MRVEVAWGVIVSLVITTSWGLVLVLHSWSIIVLHPTTEIGVLLSWSVIICVEVVLRRDYPLLLIILLLLHRSLLLLAWDKVILIGHVSH